MKRQTPRYRRLDLINSMRPGEQKRIAEKLGVSRGYVSSVLNGARNQESDVGRNIIRLAERAAADAQFSQRKKASEIRW